MADYLTKLGKFAFKAEGTPGTYETLSVAEAITPIYNASITGNPEMLDTPENGTLSKEPDEIGATPGEAAFELDCIGGGDADPFWMTNLLPSCGFAIAAHVATVSSATTGTVTLGKYYHSGSQEALVGAKGGFTFTQKRGQAGRLAFKYSGIWNQAKTLALGAITRVGTVAPKSGNTTVAVGAQTIIVPDIVIEVNNTIELVESDAAVDRDGNKSGFVYGTIMDRVILVKLSPLSLPVATLNWLTSWRAGATYAFSHIVGATNGNKMTFALPKLKLTPAPKYGDRNGLETNDLVFRSLANSSSGDDELTITNTVSA